MARLNHVKAARKAQGNCAVCHQPIGIGEPYKWVHPRYRAKIIAHPNCRIPQSMISSSKMAAVWDAVDEFDDSDVTTLSNRLRDLAQTARNVGEEYQEAADNQREYFSDSPVAEENEEKAQSLDSWADTLETVADDIEEELSELEKLQQEGKEDVAEAKEEELRTMVQDAIGEQPE